MQKQNKDIIGIYKITSPSGKNYIGQSINIHKRWSQYKKYHVHIKQTKIKNSLNKYGVEYHIFEIIEECSIEQLNEREVYWIKYYNSFNDGLNLREGGEGGAMKEETKLILRNQRLGKKLNKETCNKISKSKKGKKVSEERKQKMRKPFSNEHKISLKEGIIKSRGSKTNQYDLEGNFIKEWPSASTAEYILRGKGSNNITDCCKGKQKTAYGFIWKYKK